MTEWHTRSVADTLQELVSTESGLAPLDAETRLNKYGKNLLPESPPEHMLWKFIRQFQSPLIYLLLAAAGLVFLLGEYVDASIIVFVLLFNALVGMIQEGKAERTLSALKTFTETNATVRRSGVESIISAAELVPGDIVVISEGERIPADCRVLSNQSLKVDEAALTGESVPVYKSAEVVTGVANSPTDMPNMVFRGTHAVSGSGVAIVVATGISTYIGGIAEQIRSVQSEIPLQVSIRKLSNRIIVGVLIFSALLFVLGIARGETARDMFTTVVSLTVSVVPEGLPIVMTLILATGVWRMSKRNALVKKLQAVEALGQARVIAVDKTGTLTKNQMVVTHVFVHHHLFTVSGSGYDPSGSFSLAKPLQEGDGAIDPANHPELLKIGKIAALTTAARVIFSNEDKAWRVAGDPTEAAVMVLGQKLGFHKDLLEHEEIPVALIPFDYRLKYRAAVHKRHGKDYLSLMGAPEAVLELCTHVSEGGEQRELTKARFAELVQTFEELSSRGLRLVALAEKHDRVHTEPAHIGGLSFVGFLGLQDPLRAEVQGAMEAAQHAGMRVVMITGDHAITARAIAREAGIYHEGDQLLTGLEIESMSSAALADKLGTVSVFARVTPEHKLRIIEGYKARGEIIAMTGDGVNDAPSLVAADLGVAMGGIGTEVAKEASDIVLLDDNFGSIVAAIEEGRSIYHTIKKVILYLFSTSIAEALVIALALIVALPLPLLASQIIWLNFVTDGFLTLALAMEPKGYGLLKGVFTNASKSLIDGAMIRRMFVMVPPMALGTLFVFVIYLDNLALASTMALTVLAVVQWFNAWNCRSAHGSLFARNPLSNPYLVAATLITISLHIVAIYTPFFQRVLHTVPLTLEEWAFCIVVGSSIIWLEELRKLFYRLTHQLRAV